MNKIKMIALDMDGTTYQQLGEIIPENVPPIIKALENGVKVVFVTGRPIHAPHNKLKENGFMNHQTLIAAYNGAAIYNYENNEFLVQKPIKIELLEKAFDLIDKSNCEAEIWAYTTDLNKVILSKELSKSNYLQYEKQFFNGEYIVYKDKKDLIESFKILLFNCDQDLVNNFIKAGFEVSWTPGHIAAEVNDKNINKKFALEFLSEHWGLNKNEIMAMGDGANDVSMMSWVGLSVAPNNAVDSVKKVSKIVLDETNLQAAVGVAINKFVLEEK